MSEEKVVRWLRRADASAGPPPSLPADLAGRAVRLSARRARVRHAVAACVVAACAGAAALWLAGAGRHGSGPAADPARLAMPAAELQRRLEAIRQEERLQTQLVERMLASQRAREGRRALGGGFPQEAPEDGLSRRLDRAAYLTLRQAELLRQDGRAGPAEAAYQKVIEVFPQSFWARLAQQRRQGPGNPSGEEL